MLISGFDGCDFALYAQNDMMIQRIYKDKECFNLPRYLQMCVCVYKLKLIIFTLLRCTRKCINFYLHYTGLQETMYKLFACLLYTIKVINIYMLTLHYIKVTYMFTIFLFTFYITSCTNKTKSILSSNPLPML